MGENPPWVQNLGDAFLAQPKDVMDSVQRLRLLAQQTGALQSTPQQTVTTVTKPASTKTTTTATPTSPTVIKIESADPQVVYVPTYNPNTVYGTGLTPLTRRSIFRPHPASNSLTVWLKD